MSDTTPMFVPVDDEVLDGVVGGLNPIGEIQQLVL